MNNEQRILSRYILIFFVLLIATLGYMAFEAQASSTNRYMLLYQGTHGLNYYCLETSPYAIERPMLWDAEHGAIEVEEESRLIAAVVQVETCNYDAIYQTEGSLYTWRFGAHNSDEHENHRHITGGAYWVTWLRDLYR